MAQCTVIRNNLKIRAVYDKFDPNGIGLRLFYDTHPSLVGKYIIFPDGKVVFAYIFIDDIVAPAPPLAVIQGWERFWGSRSNWFNFGINYYNPRFSGSASFPWPMPNQLIRWGQHFDLTTGHGGADVIHLTFERYIRENWNNTGPPSHHTVNICYNFREYWFFSARIHPTLN